MGWNSFGGPAAGGRSGKREKLRSCEWMRKRMGPVSRSSGRVVQQLHVRVGGVVHVGASYNSFMCGWVEWCMRAGRTTVASASALSGACGRADEM